MMLSGGGTQRRLLAQLLDVKNGLSIDDLAQRLDISRTAVKQHLSGLERDGYVARGTARKTAGRPEQTFVLTDDGIDVFPKQYSWFSRVLLQTLRSRIGEADLGEFMFNLGVDMSAAALPRITGKTRSERILEIVRIMNETGFVAQAIEGDAGSLARIACKNCVYHDLAKDHPEVCRFDIGFISGLMGADVEQEECMQRDEGQVCRFRFIPYA
ncbi:winged helix-turn-helix transcriptional regulator [Rhizobium sp. CG5]|uniref:helix-turn-helix transcriptional regulator n=1 Tax=Rhizobium sp. CG5 TaxID=2726076 RepID=UPI0020342F98|nr:HTH domain-containing protein [Rhizobium sp. CG5]MCM2477055.1 winged helix-turn-helix transcriptional regulator [Rhizobium sp. CG5]